MTVKLFGNYSCVQSEKQALHSGRHRIKRNARRDRNMTLEELLNEEVYAKVKAAIDEINGKEPDKLKHVRFADLSEGGYISKEKYTSLETDKGSVEEQLGQANELINQLKKGTKGDDGLQGKIGEYETTITKLTAENEKLKTESSLKLILLEAGAKPGDIDYLLFRAREKGEILIGEDGKAKGQDDLIASLKAQCPSQFQTSDAKAIQEHRLEMGDIHNQEEPKTLAEALKQQYEVATKNSNLN